MVLTVLFHAGCRDQAGGYRPQDGDIVFQTSRSGQSLAIQRATKSPYSHMGIVYLKEGKPFVYEAVQPVKMTPLATWIDRGVGKRYVAKRLKSAEKILTREALGRMLAVGKEFEGRPYDLTFEWSDDRIYCSELVWKIYKRAVDVEIGKTQTLREFDLSDAAVQAKVKERWRGRPPMDEPVISPAAMYESALLMSVYEK